MLRILTSRSQHESSNGCERRGFWGYHYRLKGSGEGGIQSTRLRIPLLTGQMVHQGLAMLMMGYEEDGAVESAVEGYKEELERGELLIAPDRPDEKWPSEVFEWTAKQEMALVEAFIRLFAVNILPSLRGVYEILEVEREGLPISLAGWDQLGEKVEEEYAYRTDALMREKQDGELTLMSFKTLSYWGKMQRLQYSRDNQGASEIWSMEKQFELWRQMILEGMGERVPEWYGKEYGTEVPPKVRLVQMGVLLKGKRWEDPHRNGYYIQGSPLIHGYRQNGITSEDDKWAWSYEYPKQNKDGGWYQSKLGQNFRRTSIWEEYPGGVAEWIRQIKSGEIQPECGPCLDRQFEFAEPIYRQAFEIESWSRQMIWLETGRAERAIKMMSILRDPSLRASEKLVWLDRLFPQNRQNCAGYASVCTFDKVCFNADVRVRVEPEILEGWKERKNHHSVEEGMKE